MIQLHDLHYAYPALPDSGPSPWVLNGVDLQIQAGEWVALMGPTGSGKSTLALSLLGVVPQSLGGRIRGRVTVTGQDTRTTPVSELARTVGLVFQDPETQFLAATVEDELAFGLESFGVPRDEMQRRIRQRLHQVGMAGSEARTPHELSGGEMQRVALAAVLAMDPDVLVLDEPTTSLDPAGAASLFSLLHEMRAQSGATILLISNDADRFAPLVDRVAVLADGRIQMDAAPSQVFAEPDRLAALGLAAPQLARVQQRLSQHSDHPLRLLQPGQAAQVLAPLLSESPEPRR